MLLFSAGFEFLEPSGVKLHQHPSSLESFLPAAVQIKYESLYIAKMVCDGLFGRSGGTQMQDFCFSLVRVSNGSDTN